MTRAFLLSLLLTYAALHPTTGHAQGARDSTCTYSRCALRVDYGFWSTRLVRGSTDERVARLGWFGSGVGVLLAASDSAAHYARQYQNRRVTSDVVGLIGTALILIGWASGEGLEDGGPLTLGGLTLGLVGLPFAFASRRSLDRALWWYNRDLPRP
jgi:hypothetical protein